MLALVTNILQRCRSEEDGDWIAPMQVIPPLFAVAIVAAICGYMASAVARRKKRRARGVFLLGFFCGFTTIAILRGRRRGLKAFRAIVRGADVRPQWVGIRSGTGRFAVHTLALAASRTRCGLRSPRWLRLTR